MSRILAIDYGRKRCGLAVTDTLRIVATGLPTVRTCDLLDFLRKYMGTEEVGLVVVGLPKTLDGGPSESERYIAPFLKQLHREFPELEVRRYDERFTSTLAHRAMLDAGMSRSRRREKGLADEMAAVIILNDYLSAMR
ncbi:MAG: Holliday junction resolvase RuvX [Muribaculaceae bacterium]|nr:Holliday junction resolvase RuvX [Muribaculaceae bacterium]